MSAVFIAYSGDIHESDTMVLRVGLLAAQKGGILFHIIDNVYEQGSVIGKYSNYHVPVRCNFHLFGGFDRIIQHISEYDT
ncbi:hypothetical protein D3C87_1665950 [compost metagenome]